MCCAVQCDGVVYSSTIKILKSLDRKESKEEEVGGCETRSSLQSTTQGLDEP